MTRQLPSDPNDRALTEYYAVWEQAKTPWGATDFDKVESDLATLQASWTPEQQQFVDQNTGLTEHGPRYQEFVQAKKLLRSFFRIRDTVVRQNPAFAALDQELERATSADERQRIETRKKALITLRDRMVKQDQDAWRRQHPDRDALLVRWGYREKTIAEQDRKAPRSSPGTGAGSGLRVRP